MSGDVIHPELLKWARPDRKKPEEDPRRQILRSQLETLRRECPLVLELLEIHTEVHLGPVSMSPPPSTLTTGERLAYRAGQRSIYKVLKGNENG